jgi:hypothetical protein
LTILTYHCLNPFITLSFAGYAPAGKDYFIPGNLPRNR